MSLVVKAVWVMVSVGGAIVGRRFTSKIKPRLDLPAASSAHGGSVRARESPSTAASTTATSSSSVATTTSTAAVAGHLVQARIDLLLRLCKYCYEVTRLLGVCRRALVKHLINASAGIVRTLSGEQRDGCTSCSSTTCTTNTMHVVF